MDELNGFQKNGFKDNVMEDLHKSKWKKKYILLDDKKINKEDIIFPENEEEYNVPAAIERENEIDAN
jgi:hypothetical protein